MGLPNSSLRLVVDTDFEVLASTISRLRPIAGATATRRCQRSMCEYYTIFPTLVAEQFSAFLFKRKHALFFNLPPPILSILLILSNSYRKHTSPPFYSPSAGCVPEIFQKIKMPALCRFRGVLAEALFQPGTLSRPTPRIIPQPTSERQERKWEP